MGGEDCWRLGHRPALDGLRGVAIVLVLFHHARVPGAAAAGMVGVTLFFALSGFLITGLLLDELAEAGRVDFRRFYARRARRLFPAALAVVAAVAIARVVLGPWVVDWWVIAPVLLYLGNWVPAIGYDPGALGAMWTLAVEEQFYLIWPVLVVLAGRRSRVVLLALGLAVASLLQRLSMVADGVAYTRIYVGSDTVAFAILVGAVAVGLRASGGPGRSSNVLTAVGITGLVALCVPQEQSWMVWTFPAAALVACGLLWVCTGREAVLLLEGSALRWFGSRSYGIYLWHAPILWAMAENYHLPWPVLLVIGVPVSLLVAEGSYRWVEAPFRARRSAPHPASGRAGGASSGSGQRDSLRPTQSRTAEAAEAAHRPAR